MRSSQLHYLPLNPTFFAVLVIVFLALVMLIQLGILRYAYMRLGVSSRAALLLLLGSLIGSYVNIPILELPGQLILSPPESTFFARHSAPIGVAWSGTVIALNVGGAVIPIVMSLYLLITNRLWGPALLTTACVAAICYWLAQPVPGVGIALPILVPAFATALAALLIARRHAAALAYIGGSLGTLIGADLLNLGNVYGLGAPVVSIGGAGTFDGIFLISVLAVLIASLSSGRDRASLDPEPIAGHSR